MKVDFLSAFVTALFVLRSYVLTSELTSSQKAAITRKFISSGTTCMRDNPLTISDIQSLKNMKLPNKKNAKCFIKCFLMDLGIMNDMGKTSPAQAKAKAMEIFQNDAPKLSNVEQIIKGCSRPENMMHMDEESKKNCDVATYAFNCLVKNAPKFGFGMTF